MDQRISKLDQLILSDPTLGPALFDQLREAQRELRLLHGDRPTSPFLRPHILSRQQYEQIKHAAQVIAHAFEKLAREALRNPNIMATLHLTPLEEEMARIDPGYSRLCINSRLDSYLTSEGFQFLEYNAETPAGVGDQMQLEKVLFTLPALKEFLSANRHWLPQPHRALLNSLLDAYREWGGVEERPHIAIVDWHGVPTASEFGVLQDFFVSSGYPTMITDPHDLSYDGDRLHTKGVRIDIVYKRVVIHEFLNRFNQDHPLVRAYEDKRVCMANSFRPKLVHKKAGFAILSDPVYDYLFEPHELEVIHAHIPWTRLVQPSNTIFQGVECDLLSLTRDHREQFVLKPNDDYGGHGVYLGWECDAGEWDLALKQATERTYVVQERVASEKTTIPAYSDHVSLDELYVDFNPFLFQNQVEGALIRLSASALLNVSSGGGQTALLVLEDEET
jgi:hypothetical protein